MSFYEKEGGPECTLVLRLLRKHEANDKVGNALPLSSLARKNTTLENRGIRNCRRSLLCLLALDVTIAVVNLPARSQCTWLRPDLSVVIPGLHSAGGFEYKKLSPEITERSVSLEPKQK